MVSMVQDPMKCEEFELLLVSDLYGELAAEEAEQLRAHEESCQACTASAARLRKGKGASLPLLSVPDDLEARILAAVKPHFHEKGEDKGAVVEAEAPASMPASAAMPHAAAEPPKQSTWIRALTWAGSHAMRPQLAMAAVFVLVVGSSLLLLRATPDSVTTGPVRVTEKGAPETTREAPAAAATATAASEAAPPPPMMGAPQQKAAPREQAYADEREEKQEAKKPKDAPSASPADAVADADKLLAAARSKRSSEGCKAAIAQLEELANSHPNSSQGRAAASEAADCYKAQGAPIAAAAPRPAKPAAPVATAAPAASASGPAGSGGGKLAAPPRAPAKMDPSF